MASQDHEKAMDGLLRRSLARDSAPRAECPDAELLAAYYDRSLGVEEAAGYELHFSQCSRCREQLAAMARAEEETPVENEIPAEPVFVTSRAAAERSEPVAVNTVAPKRAPSALQIPARLPRKRLDLRWLAPIAAVALFAVFVYFRLSPREAKVAMNGATIGATNGPITSTTPSAVEATQPPSPSEAPQHSSSAATSSSAVRSAPTPVGPAANEPSRPSTNSKPLNHPTSSTAPAPPRAQAGAVSAAPTRSNYAARAGVATAAKARADAPAARTEYASTNAEQAPAAPSPELKGSLPEAVVVMDSADAVKSPEPPSPRESTSAKKIQGFSALGIVQNRADASTAQMMKSANRRSSSNVIPSPDSNALYRIAGGGFIERTGDAGATWSGQMLNAASEFTAGSAPSPDVCWLVGRAGVIFLTDDGKNWRQISPPAPADFTSVSAQNALSATVTADGGRRWITVDGGKSWSPAK